MPRYFDYRYNCDMEILRFDSSEPNPKYRSWIDRLCAELSAVSVVSTGLPEAAAAFAGAPELEPANAFRALPTVLLT